MTKNQEVETVEEQSVPLAEIPRTIVVFYNADILEIGKRVKGDLTHESFKNQVRKDLRLAAESDVNGSKWREFVTTLKSLPASEQEELLKKYGQ